MGVILLFFFVNSNLATFRIQIIVVSLPKLLANGSIRFLFGLAKNNKTSSGLASVPGGTVHARRENLSDRL